MPTMKEHEAVLREKCRNGILYRNDGKLAAWLAIPVGDVPDVLAELISADVLRSDGHAAPESSVTSSVFPRTCPTTLVDSTG